MIYVYNNDVTSISPHYFIAIACLLSCLYSHVIKILAYVAIPTNCHIKLIKATSFDKPLINRYNHSTDTASTFKSYIHY